MTESRQKQAPTKKKDKQKDESASTVTRDRQKELRKLDEFIEGVLEQAGEEFLEDFKQVEGE